MDEAYKTERMTFEGHEFEVSLYSDHDIGPPWEVHDGHGVIREVYTHGRPEKSPGEVVMYSDRGQHWLYDVKATTELALKDGWGLAADDLPALEAKLGHKPSKREIAAEAVQNDMKLCRGWLRTDWWWCGVAVRLIRKDGKPVGDKYEHAVWGIESNSDYWKEVAKEIALGEILHPMLKEEAERLYWAERDTNTETA